MPKSTFLLKLLLVRNQRMHTGLTSSQRCKVSALKRKMTDKKMAVEHTEITGNSPRSKRTIAASLAALGSLVLASSCCLPMFPFLLAAGAAGSSAFFARIRPFLLVASVLLIAFGFYQRWRAKQCNCRPNPLSAVLLWASAVVVVASTLFPQLIANLVANLLAR